MKLHDKALPASAQKRARKGRRKPPHARVVLRGRIESSDQREEKVGEPIDRGERCKHKLDKEIGETGKGQLPSRFTALLGNSLLASRENAHPRAMLRLALAAASKRGAAAALENVLPSTSSVSSSAAASSFVRSFAALPATTSEPSSPFLRFASPAPVAHDFTPALQGLPETKVKRGVANRRLREMRASTLPSSKIAHRVFPLSFHSFFLRPRQAPCSARACRLRTRQPDPHLTFTPRSERGY